MSTHQILQSINIEDISVPKLISKSIAKIVPIVEIIADKLLSGGHLYYIGAGTSGRLGIVDASECPPTFGVDQDLVVGLIAGGDGAIRKAVEFAEDDSMGGWNDLKNHNITSKDFVIGIAASGTTPYVVGALKMCAKNEIETACITCNEHTPLSEAAKYPIEIVVGPEFVTGSTRMKAGTAQKLVLNMISTSVMIRLGRVKDNKMVDMQLSNEKLVDRGTKMVIEQTGLNYEKAKTLLLEKGSVRKAIESIHSK